MQFFNYKRNATLVKDKLKVPDGYPNDPEAYELRFHSKDNDKKKLKILVLCDSFGGYFSKFLKEHFNETVFIWDTKFDKKLILQEKPDIIIQEFVSRNSDFLLKKEY